MIFKMLTLSIDPVRDIEIIETEMMLADLELFKKG